MVDQSLSYTKSRTDSHATPTMRVLLWSPPGSGEGRYGGVRTYSARLYAAAPADSVRVTLAHGAADQPKWPRFASQHLISPLFPSATLFRRASFGRRGAAWIRAHSRDFDVFHGMTAFHSTIEPALAAKRVGLPAVVFIANSGPEIAPEGLLHRMLGSGRRRGEALRSMDAIISMSREIGAELRSIGVREDAIVRIPNQTDVRRFRPCSGPGERAESRRLLGWADRWTILLVGELVPRKRPHLLIEALEMLVQRGINAQLALVGPFNDPAYASRLRAMADVPAVRGRVLFELDNRTVDIVYRGSDVFCLPSINEGMPASLVEAAASGLPCLASRFSSAAECIIEGQTGRVLDEAPDLAAQIAECLRSYHDNQTLAELHGKAGRSHAVLNFSADATWAAHERLFRRLTAGG